MRVRRTIIGNLRHTTVLGVALLALCGTAAPLRVASPARSPATLARVQADLSSIKTYLIGKTHDIVAGVVRLQAATDTYYALARADRFDYPMLWTRQPARVWAAFRQARDAFRYFSPHYEQVEGIVAGLPALIPYDVALDSGAPGSGGGGTVVPFDLHLLDGRVLRKPGNLFSVIESTLWGTYAAYTVPRVTIVPQTGASRQAVPDANVLKGAADTLARYVAALLRSEEAWRPTVTDAFNCLIINVPTISDFFTIWRNSRYVMGARATRRDFVARSRLWDIADNVGSWLVLYHGLSPLVRTVDPQGDALIMSQLSGLQAFVNGLARREKSGKHFTPEEADLLGAESQNRATAITGQIIQVATELHVPITTA